MMSKDKATSTGTPSARQGETATPISAGDKRLAWRREIVEPLEIAQRCHAELEYAAAHLGDGIRLGDDLEDLMRDIMHSARFIMALRLFFVALSENGTREVTLGEHNDCLDVFEARGGSIAAIAADVRAGKYRNHPRSEDDELLFNDTAEDDAA